MSVCSGYDYRQRDATLVHQHMTLASIFSPYPWDLVPQLLLPTEPLPLLHQYFATPRQYSSSSYSTKPARHNWRKKPSLSHWRKYEWIELALPKRSFGKAFHWQPVLNTYTIPSKTFRDSMSLRPPPAFLLYSLSAFLFGKTGISGLTLSQNASDTSQDRILAISTSINLRLSMEWNITHFLKNSYFLRISSKFGFFVSRRMTVLFFHCHSEGGGRLKNPDIEIPWRPVQHDIHALHGVVQKVSKN